MNRLDKEKRLIYRSCHRGCKETDILLGEFASSELSALSNVELEGYEKLLGVNDVDIYNWLTEQTQVPTDFDNSVFNKIREFNKEQCLRKINTKFS